MLGFGSFETAEKTIYGIETMHMIRKGQIEEIEGTEKLTVIQKN